MKTKESICLLLCVIAACAFLWELSKFNSALRVSTRAAVAPTAESSQIALSPGTLGDAEIQKSEGRKPLDKTAAKWPHGAVILEVDSKVRRTARPEALFAEFHQLKTDYLTAYEGGLVAHYMPFFLTQGLSKEQIGQFEGIWKTRRGQWADIEEARHAANDDASANNIVKLEAQSTAQLESSLKGLLGEDGFRNMQDFRNTSNEREMVEALVIQSSYANSPVMFQQGEQMVKLLTEARLGVTMINGALEVPSQATVEQLLAQSQRILSQEQFIVFRHLVSGRLTANDQMITKLLNYNNKKTGGR